MTDESGKIDFEKEAELEKEIVFACIECREEHSSCDVAAAHLSKWGRSIAARVEEESMIRSNDYFMAWVRGEHKGEVPLPLIYAPKKEGTE